MPPTDLAPGPLVDEYLRRHMIPDPESAAELVAPDMQIRFTGNRPMKHPAEATAFNAGRYAWVKKKIDATEVVAGGTDECTIVYSRGTLYGAALGAALVNYAKSTLTAALPEVWLFVLGALFVLVTIALPKGCVGLFERVRRLRHA